MPNQKSDVVRVIPAGAPTSIGENHFVNCYPESVENNLTQVKRAYCVKRKGLKNTLVSKSGATGEARGVYYWANTDYTFMVYGGTVYAYSSASTTVEQFTVSLTTTTGPVGFTETIYGDSRKLFFCDGVRGYLINSSAPTTVVEVSNQTVTDYVITNAGTGYTSAPTVSFSGGGGSGAAATATVSGGGVVGIVYSSYGTGYTSAPTISFSGGGGSGAAATAVLNSFPNPHIAQPKFMDGFLFLAKDGTASVYNCLVGDYQVWRSSSYIYTNQQPGNVYGLARYQNYLLALKSDSIEYLYNAGNLTGSPLSRTTQASTNIGVGQTDTIQEIEDDIFFVGKAAGGGYGVWSINNFKESKISTEYIDQVLNEDLGLYSVPQKSVFFLSAFVLRVDGHKFYVINEVGTTANQRALVYDIEERFWSFWDSGTVPATKRYIGTKAATKGGVSIVQIPVASSTGKVLYHSTTTTTGDYNDDGVVYYMYYNTPVIDMDNRYRKRYNRVEVIGNKYSYSNLVNIQYSDSVAEGIDQLSNTSWTVNLQTGLQGYLTNLGSSRARIWQIGHTTDNPLRFENVELFYSQGEH